MSDMVGLFIAGTVIFVFTLAIAAEIILERFYGE